MILIVISENIFSKFIELDNKNIEIILKNLFLIYSKNVKRTKLKYFLKFKYNTILTKFLIQKENNEKRKISYNKSKVYERLFNYSIIKEKKLCNLSNKYLIDEEDKYTFSPKINSKDSNYYIHYQSLYKTPFKNNYSERNSFNVTFENKLKNLKNNIENYTNNIKNKYIPIMKNKSNPKYKTNYSIFSDNNSNFHRTFNANHFLNANKIKKNEFIPISTKSKGNDNLNINFLENGNRNNFDNINFNSKNSMKKSFSCGFFPLKNFLTINKGPNSKIHSMNRIPFPNNNCTISKNNDFYIFLKNKTKNKKRIKCPKEIIIPKRNGQNIEHERKLVHSSNSSISLHNNSSLGCSLLNENIKLKSRQSHDKKEKLFSFGSAIFYADNKKAKNINVNSNKNKKGLIKRNSSLKIGNSIRSQRYQISTKSSGTNTNSYYNNYNLNYYKEKAKNGIEKNNKLEIQGINEYSIINDLNLLDNEFLNLQTTLQTLTDSKILDLANNYISEDDSLEMYKRNNDIYNKKKA